VNVFKNEKAVIPIGYNDHDIIIEVSPLFDDFFHNVSTPDDEIEFWL